ncbi:4Fe-4S dicluster domain-containing protein [Desulfovibrio inopinatus]|uniref:4Fe-4S dicluster domain-containing protein n=1 Tax=Desulfovibrio inopinatus TaxID=102109 RepID=UPI00041598CD|nr:4Fe-4S binding protein [Desulfovibrio inopinatus]
MKKKGQTRVVIYPDWCKGCGICAAFCPVKAIELGPNGKARVVREDECINCGFCEMHCPDFAISIEPRDEEPAGATVLRETEAATNGERYE